MNMTQLSHHLYLQPIRHYSSWLEPGSLNLHTRSPILDARLLDMEILNLTLHKHMLHFSIKLQVREAAVWYEKY
jgi:hypothetical protein